MPDFLYCDWILGCQYFATPAAYKYEPLGAQKFRQKKGFKGGNN